MQVNHEHHPNEILCTHVEAVQKQLEMFLFTCLQNILVFSNQAQIKFNIKIGSELPDITGRTAFFFYNMYNLRLTIMYIIKYCIYYNYVNIIFCKMRACLDRVVWEIPAREIPGGKYRPGNRRPSGQYREI